MVGFPGPHDPYDPADDFPDTYRPEDMPAPIPASPSHGHSLRETRKRERATMGMDLSTYTEGEMRDVRAHYTGLVKQIDHEVGEIIDTLRPSRRPRSRGQGHLLRGGDPHTVDCAGARPGEGLDLLGPGKLRDVTATMLALAGCDLPAYMDAQALSGLEIDGLPPRSHIFGILTEGWMAFDGRYKLCKYSPGGAMLFDLHNDRHEQDNLVDNPEYAEIYRSLDAALTRELMDSMAFAMHDRMPLPYSMSLDEDVAREGWAWRFPSSASAATEVQDPY